MLQRVCSLRSFSICTLPVMGYLLWQAWERGNFTWRSGAAHLICCAATCISFISGKTFTSSLLTVLLMSVEIVAAGKVPESTCICGYVSPRHNTPPTPCRNAAQTKSLLREDIFRSTSPHYSLFHYFSSTRDKRTCLLFFALLEQQRAAGTMPKYILKWVILTKQIGIFLFWD